MQVQHHHFESTKNGTTCKHLALEGIVSRRSGLALGAFLPSVSSFRTLANGSSCSPILNMSLTPQTHRVGAFPFSNTRILHYSTYAHSSSDKSFKTYLALLIITVLGIKKWNFLRSPLQRFEIHLFNHPLSILRCGRIPLFFFHCLPF